MKRATHTQLTVRRETLRALAIAELAHAIGGAMNPADTAKVACPIMALAIPQRGD
jgi:hypothetical protein